MKRILTEIFPPQVKRQAMLEIQRAVAAAETRAIEMITQERLKMEKIYSDLSRSTDDGDSQSPGSNVRKIEKCREKLIQ